MPASNASPRSLGQVIRSAHLRMAVVAIALAGALLLLVGVLVLRYYLGHNARILARSLAYTVEAALVFDDRVEAMHVLEQMLPGEGIAHARVLDARQETFVQWPPPAGQAAEPSGPGSAEPLGERLARLMALEPGRADILLDGQEPAGSVVLHSDGRGLAQFLVWGLVVLGLCLGLSSLLGLALSRRMLAHIVRPLQELARVARAVRHERSMGQRVGPAQIAELRALGDDFNALLDELQMRYERLVLQNSTLSQQAATDSLTGLANRLAFEHGFVEALNAARHGGQNLALLFLDSDRFKQVNDEHGHAAGDALLCCVAQRLKAQMRESDLVARLGGDEFAVLMYPLGKNAEQAVRQAVDKIQNAVGAPVCLDNGTLLHPSVSVGAALFPLHGQSWQDLMEYADRRMYKAKAAKKSPLATPATAPMP